MSKFTLWIILSLFAFIPFGISKVDAKVDCIEIIKHKRELNLIENDKVVKTYWIALGKHPKGHKQQEEDNRTPEGSYFITKKQSNCTYHRKLHISYPSPEDRAQAESRGVNPGSNISIHGLPSYLGYFPNFMVQMHRWYDWTDGSIAVTDSEIEEIFDQVDEGIPVIIFS